MLRRALTRSGLFNLLGGLLRAAVLLALQLSQDFIQAVEAFLPEKAVLFDPVGGVLEGAASNRQGRHWASRRRSISPARSRTLRCLEIAGRLMAKGSASSVTDFSPEARRARMARRVGSARAAKVVLRISGVSVLTFYFTIWLINLMVKYMILREKSRGNFLGRKKLDGCGTALRTRPGNVCFHRVGSASETWSQIAAPRQRTRWTDGRAVRLRRHRQIQAVARVELDRMIGVGDQDAHLGGVVWAVAQGVTGERRGPP